jgi:nucleoside 2-deoxyribosyltransferase
LFGGGALKIYTAGPLGFSQAGSAFHNDVILPKLIRLGHEPLDPWRLTDRAKIDAVLALPYGEARREAWRKLNVEIGGNNLAAIDRCDLVFAVLDGTDVDSGTAAEIGYAFARDKKIIGYRGDFRLSADNEGLVVNLQVEYFIRQSGGEIITRISDLETVLDGTL